MSWIHSSEVAALALVLAVSVAAVGTATAVTISGDPPEPAQVGEEVSMSITIEEPFAEAPDQWTLQGETDLENASWTVTTLEQGRTLNTTSYGSSNFTTDLDIESGTTTIEITVEGTTPELTQFNYDDTDVENFTVASIGQVTGEGNVNTFESYEIMRYTEQSREARQAIAEAEEAVNASGSQEAQNQLSNAKAFYNNQEFERAISEAENAQQTAEQAQSSLPIIPIAGGAVILVLLIAGGLYYRSQKKSQYKLQ